MKRLETAHDDLDAIGARCRGKSEAARWAAERLRRLGEGNAFPLENPAMDQELVEWADKLTDCFYWMTAANDSQPTDISIARRCGRVLRDDGRGVIDGRGSGGTTLGRTRKSWNGCFL